MSLILDWNVIIIIVGQIIGVVIGNVGFAFAVLSLIILTLIDIL